MQHKQQHRPSHPRARKRRKPIFLVVVSGAVLLVLIALILALILPGLIKEPGPTVPDEETVIELAFAGDVTATEKVIQSGESDGSYDFTQVFTDVLPLLADADLTVVNFEGNLCGPPYGKDNTSAPPELLQALSRAGVDMVQAANSCTINNGLLGMEATLEGIRAAGLEPLGAFASPEEFREQGGFTLRDVQGVKVAFVAFTKGMDNIALPAGKEDCVNLLYSDYTSSYQKVDTEGITQVLRNVAAQEPDVTVALVHWGSEYNAQISNSQKKIVKLMKSEGVDAIVGTHSHIVQEMDFDEDAGTLVAYSLGDLLGDADRNQSSYSTILKLQVIKNQTTGETRIAGYTYDPVYNLYTDSKAQLLRMNPAIRDYEADGITPVTEEAYQAMLQATKRVDKLCTPAPEENE